VTRFDRLARSHRLLFAALALLLAGGMLWVNLDGYPRLWFDEGLHLLVARHLARTGEYRFGPAIGPTVFYPVAAAFRLLGVGVWQARWVIAGYALVALALGFALARAIGDSLVGWLSLALWLTSPGLNLLGWGREVLGELPAWAFFLAGLLSLHAGIRSDRLSWTALGGIGLGLAILTKNQFAIVLPAFLVTVAIDRMYHRQMRFSRALVVFLLMLAVPLVWYVTLRHIGGERLLQRTVEEWQTAPERSIWLGNLQVAFRSARFVLGPRAFLGLGVVGLLCALPWLRRRDAGGVASFLLWSFAVLWLGWYVIFSVGWQRYAFAGLAAAVPFAARLLALLWRRAWARRAGRPSPLAARIAMSALLAGVILAPWMGRAVALFARSDRTAYQMAAYIEAHVADDALIEAWEPEIAFLTDARYHFPSSRMLDAVSRARALGMDPPPYDPLAADPDYILVGEFGWWTGLYSSDFLQACCRPVKTIGTYVLFEVDR